MSGQILVDRSVLSCLSAIAEVAVFDLTDGLADGTYDEDYINGWSSEAIQAAIDEVDTLLAEAAA